MFTKDSSLSSLDTPLDTSNHTIFQLYWWNARTEKQIGKIFKGTLDNIFI